MKSSKGKFLVLAAVLMLVAAPAVADDHLNETDSDEPEDDSDIEEEEDSEIDGTDNSTELTVEKSEAERTAREALSDNNWTLERSSTHEDDGYYRFRFTVEGEDAEAEVHVDGSSGEVFRVKEELEHEEDIEELRKEHRQKAIEARIEAKERKINFYQSRIKELREEIEALKNGELVPEHSENETGKSKLPDQADDRFEAMEREAEVEVRRDGNETEVEAEAEQGEREAEAEAEGPDRNTRNGRADRGRPGFVSRMFSGFFN